VNRFLLKQIPLYGGESLNLTVMIMQPPATATLYYRSLGNGSYTSIPLTNQDRGIYKVSIPAQQDDFEYYIQANTAVGSATYPSTAPEINQTVIVGPGVISGLEPDNILRSFELHQNYPNPFNATTKIQYYLPRSSEVQMSIYDLLGREVKKLIDKRQSSGLKKIEWDGKNRQGDKVASGMYIYRIIAKKFKSNQVFEQARKMILIK